MTVGIGKGRIPLALQAIFIASNRERDVKRPPPPKSASKTFLRSFLKTLKSKGRKGNIRNEDKIIRDEQLPAIDEVFIVNDSQDGVAVLKETPHSKEIAALLSLFRAQWAP
jgi:FMN-dependent NADH-azoreductase